MAKKVTQNIDLWGKENQYMIPTAALAHGLEFPRVGVVKRNLNNAQRPCEVEKTEFEETKYMIPTAALAHGLEFPRGGIVKRNLNNAQRPCEVEKTEFEETKSSRI